jgi:hypothetical protein
VLKKDLYNQPELVDPAAAMGTGPAPGVRYA